MRSHVCLMNAQIGFMSSQEFQSYQLGVMSPYIHGFKYKLIVLQIVKILVVYRYMFHSYAEIYGQCGIDFTCFNFWQQNHYMPLYKTMISSM